MLRELRVVPDDLVFLVEEGLVTLELLFVRVEDAFRNVLLGLVTLVLLPDLIVEFVLPFLVTPFNRLVE